MKQGLVTLLYNFCKRFMGWTLHMIMCVLLCYPVSIHMSQLLSTGRPISSLFLLMFEFFMFQNIFSGSLVQCHFSNCALCNLFLCTRLVQKRVVNSSYVYCTCSKSKSVSEVSVYLGVCHVSISTNCKVLRIPLLVLLQIIESMLMLHPF